jgi:hypothetical protein
MTADSGSQAESSSEIPFVINNREMAILLTVVSIAKAVQAC